MKDKMPEQQPLGKLLAVISCQWTSLTGSSRNRENILPDPRRINKPIAPRAWPRRSPAYPSGLRGRKNLLHQLSPLSPRNNLRSLPWRKGPPSVVILTTPGFIGVRKNPYCSPNLSLAMVFQYDALDRFRPEVLLSVAVLQEKSKCYAQSYR